MINNAVLASLQISRWEPHAKDKKASQEVAAEKKVKDVGMCRVRKSLLPKTASLRTIYQIEMAARQFHYKHTHAWVYDGPRILTSTSHREYAQKMEEFKAKFYEAVASFEAEYLTIKEKAKEILGELFDEKDYPGAHTLSGRFSFAIGYMPLPASGALYELGFSIEDADEMAAGMETSIRNSYRAAQNKLWDDLFDKLKKLEFRLQDEDAHIHASTLAILTEFSKTLPKVTLFEDSELVDLAKTMEMTLTTVTSEGLKANPQSRKDFHEKIKEFKSIAEKNRTLDHIFEEQESTKRSLSI